MAKMCIMNPAVRSIIRRRTFFVVLALNIDSCGRRVFSVVLPFLWNSRPQSVRDAESLEIFRLKTAGNCSFFIN